MVARFVKNHIEYRVWPYGGGEIVSKKNLYECPSCGAMLSIPADLDTCPVCQERLTSDDEARYLIFTEQEIFEKEESAPESPSAPE